MSLRSDRQALLDDTELRGADFSRAYTAIADAWLAGLVDDATKGDTLDLALLAVGGYGRGELCPYSDIDVVLVHQGRRDISAVADAIWYPVWDEGVKLDHSVRRPAEVLTVAGEDLRVALGLLEGRVVCGNPAVGQPVVDAAAEQWRRQAVRWLPALAASIEERHRVHGEVAFLLEPDLKEAQGGLRDIGAVRAVSMAVPGLLDGVAPEPLAASAATLEAARVELQRVAGRPLNRLLLQEQDQVAAVLGYTDADDLMAAISAAGRTIAWVADDIWLRRFVWERALAGEPGRRRRWSRGRHSRDEADGRGSSVGIVAGRSASAAGQLVEPGIVVAEGEVTLADDAEVATDPTLMLRLAAVSAERDLPLNRAMLDRLAADAVFPTTPWSAQFRESFVRVLAAGASAIRPLETLDHGGFLVGLLPEWAAVRNKPQRNAFHRYTVDRHLLEAAAIAATLTDRVNRPDLLLIGALLHDIGKGFPGDHTLAGMEVIASMGRYMGLPSEDVDTLVSLVRNHLVLPDMATRRDLDDPATIDVVVTAVVDRTTLDLLAAVVEADGIATGSSAWGAWKAALVDDLASRVALRLDGASGSGTTTDPALEDTGSHRALWVTDEHRRLMAEARTSSDLVLSVDEPRLVVAAPDRVGLLAHVTAVLAIRGLNVRSADASSEDGVAVELFTVEPAQGRWPNTERLRSDLRAALAGQLDLEAALAERERTYATRKRTSPHEVTTRLSVDNSASATSTVIEVRAQDRVGLLHRITQALFDCHLDVRTARVATIGDEVVDAFYVRNASGSKLQDPGLIRDVRHAIVDRLEDGPAAER